MFNKGLTNYLIIFYLGDLFHIFCLLPFLFINMGRRSASSDPRYGTRKKIPDGQPATLLAGPQPPLPLLASPVRRPEEVRLLLLVRLPRLQRAVQHTGPGHSEALRGV